MFFSQVAFKAQGTICRGKFLFLLGTADEVPESLSLKSAEKAATPQSLQRFHKI